MAEPQRESSYERSRRMLSDMNEKLRRDSEERTRKKGGALGNVAVALKKDMDGKDEQDFQAMQKEREDRRASMTDTSVNRLPGEPEPRQPPRDLGGGGRAGDSRDELERFMRAAQEPYMTAGDRAFKRRFDSQGPNGQGALEFENNFRVDQRFRDLARQPASPMDEAEKQKILAEIGKSAAQVVASQQPQGGPAALDRGYDLAAAQGQGAPPGAPGLPPGAVPVAAAQPQNPMAAQLAQARGIPIPAGFPGVIQPVPPVGNDPRLDAAALAERRRL